MNGRMMVVKDAILDLTELINRVARGKAWRPAEPPNKHGESGSGGQEMGWDRERLREHS